MSAPAMVDGSGRAPRVQHPLGQQIRAVREASGLSRRELASATKLSESTIKNLESGRHVPAPVTIGLLTQAMGEDPRLKAWLSPETLRKERDQFEAQAQALQKMTRELLGQLLAHATLTDLTEAIARAGVDRKKLAIALLQEEVDAPGCQVRSDHT